MSRISAFSAELRRRRVFRVAAVYGGVAFVITEIVGNTFSYLNIPDWFGTAIIVLLIIGFPIAIGLAWAFDITEDGIVRARGRSADAKRKAVPLVGNTALVLIAIVAVAFGIWGRWGGGVDANLSVSVAVLPFANMSNDPEQQYFSDGVAEEILNHLAHLPGLQVAGRTSSFSFRGQNKDLRAIGKALGVSHLLEGSVRRAGNRVKITAQLVKSTDGFHIWSETYERPMTDIFAIQSEIGIAIARALETHLLDGTRREATVASEPDHEAYDLYLRARFHLAKRTIHDLEESVAYFERAVEADPSYSRAHEILAMIAYLNNQADDLQKQVDWLAAYGDSTRVTFYRTLRSVLLHDADRLARNLAQLTREVEAGTVAAYHLAYVYHELGELDNMAKWFILHPQEIILGGMYMVRIMAETIVSHADPTIRAILDRPEHKDYFAPRLSRIE